MPSLLLSISRLLVIRLLSAAPVTAIAPTEPVTDSLLWVSRFSLIVLLSPPPVLPSSRIATPVTPELPLTKPWICNPRIVLLLACKVMPLALAPARAPSSTITGAPAA
jgi:hypothetical protein